MVPVDRLHETRRSNYELKLSAATTDSLSAWHALPSMIRRDVSMASLRSLHEPHEVQTGIGGDDDIDYDVDDDVSVFGCGDNKSTAGGDELPADGDDASQLEAISGRPAAWTQNRWVKRTTTVALCAIWLACVAVLALHSGKVVTYKQLAVQRNGDKYYPLQLHPTSGQFILSIRGSIQAKSPTYNHHKMLRVSLHGNNNYNATSPLPNTVWAIALAPEHEIDTCTPTATSRYYDLTALGLQPNDSLTVRLHNGLTVDAAFELAFDGSPPVRSTAPIYGAVLLLLLYGTIILELVHRTFAAIVASIAGVALLAHFDSRPELPEIMHWIEVDTMLLLFAMMLVVAVLGETGVFDWLAVLVFRVSGGRIWTLVHCLCVVTVLVSAVLDNVTTVLLMAPVCIRLCEVMALNPRPILLAIVLHANVGGAITPVGDPLSLIIFSNPVVRRSGITFLSYTGHMGAGVVLILGTTALLLRHQYRDLRQLRLHVSLEYTQLWREMRVWKRAAQQIPALSSHSVRQVRRSLLAKVRELSERLRTMTAQMERTPAVEYRYTLAELQHKYPIKNPALLAKAAACLALTVGLFFAQALPGVQLLSLGWCALLGVILLLVAMDHADMDALLHRIDWSTLLFLCSMFVTMACVERLRLIEWLGTETHALIVTTVQSPAARLTVAILLVLWVTMVCAAFVDSYVVAAMMVRVVVAQIGDQQQHSGGGGGGGGGGGAVEAMAAVPLQPLVWALTFGAALGSAGALYGASANVVAACVAEQHGYRMTFVGYLRQCFPTVAVNTAVISVYLVVCHVLCGWNH